MRRQAWCAGIYLSKAVKIHYRRGREGQAEAWHGSQQQLLPTQAEGSFCLTLRENGTAWLCLYILAEEEGKEKLQHQKRRSEEEEKERKERRRRMVMMWLCEGRGKCQLTLIPVACQWEPIPHSVSQWWSENQAEDQGVRKAVSDWPIPIAQRRANNDVKICVCEENDNENMYVMLKAEGKAQCLPGMSWTETSVKPESMCGRKRRRGCDHGICQ